jgi:hypothetical protein
MTRWRWALSVRGGLAALGLVGLAGSAAWSVEFARASLLDPLDLAHEAGRGGREPGLQLAALAGSDSPAYEPGLLVTKPLFSPSRTPPAPPVAAPPPEPEPPPPVRVEERPPPRYIVGGVIVSPALRKTLLRKQKREPGQWLSQGEKTREGWTVATISPDEVILTRGERRHTIPVHTTPEERALARDVPSAPGAGDDTAPQTSGKSWAAAASGPPRRRFQPPDERNLAPSANPRREP